MEQENNAQITIDIWSDVVCPFCYVGKKKLEKAITELDASKNVKVVWHSFQLDPSFPVGESMSTTEYLVKRKGYPADQVVVMQDRLESVGAQYGINFQFDKAKSFNTGNIHRLLQWAKKENKADELKEQLMHAYFTEGVDLNDTTNIISVVIKSGLDTISAKAILKGTDYQTEVKNDIVRAKELGIRGVPYFLINGTQVISGAQDDKVFLETLKKALKNSKANKLPITGVCLPNGKCE